MKIKLPRRLRLSLISLILSALLLAVICIGVTRFLLSAPAVTANQPTKPPTNITVIKAKQPPMAPKVLTLINTHIDLRALSAAQAIKLLKPYLKTLQLDKLIITPLPNSNTLWVRGDKKSVAVLQQVLQSMDHVQPQIVIRAYLVSIDDRYAHTFGTEINSVSTKNNLTMDLPMSLTGRGQVTLPITSIGNSQLLQVQLSALTENGHATILSSPQIVTANYKPALIETGEEVPYQAETANGSTHVSFKKAVLQLKVTPMLINDHELRLNIHISQDKVSQLTVKGEPAIHTQTLTTEVKLHTGNTVILGGIYEDSQQQNQESVPFISKIPLIGWLFRHQQQVHTRHQLFVFITPKILRS